MIMAKMAVPNLLLREISGITAECERRKVMVLLSSSAFLSFLSACQGLEKGKRKLWNGIGRY